MAETMSRRLTTRVRFFSAKQGELPFTQAQQLLPPKAEVTGGFSVCTTADASGVPEWSLVRIDARLLLQELLRAVQVVGYSGYIGYIEGFEVQIQAISAPGGNLYLPAAGMHHFLELSFEGIPTSEELRMPD